MSRLTDSKINILPIVSAHFATLHDARTKRRRLQDYLEMFLPALAAGVASFALGWTLKSGGTILVGTGVLGAFLFTLTIRELEHAEDYALMKPQPGARTSRYADLVEQLAANAEYATLVSFLATGLLMVADLAFKQPPGTPRWYAAIVVAVLAHLGVTMLMVLRRVFLRTHERLVVARTGAEIGSDKSRSA